MAAVEPSILETEKYSPSDLRAVAERELEALKHEGWAVVEPIKKGRFRRTQGSAACMGTNSMGHQEREALLEDGGPTVRTAEEEAGAVSARRVLEESLTGCDGAPAGQWVIDQGELIDQFPMAVVVVNAPLLRGH